MVFLFDFFVVIFIYKQFYIIEIFIIIIIYMAINAIKDVNNQSFPRVIFGFSESWEINNWYEVCMGRGRFGQWSTGDIPLEVVQIIKKEKETKKEEVLDKIRPLFNQFIQKPEIIELKSKYINRVEKNWNHISSNYFTLLSKILDVPVGEFKREYHAFLTFCERCPFGDSEFMFNRFLDISNIAAHEIMHIEFLRKYKDYCKDTGLSNVKIDHFKEILTVLLNEEMSDILFRPDSGYLKHQEIRLKILEIYRKNKKENKKFIHFLDEAIDVIKKTDI